MGIRLVRQWTHVHAHWAPHYLLPWSRRCPYAVPTLSVRCSMLLDAVRTLCLAVARAQATPIANSLPSPLFSLVSLCLVDSGSGRLD